MTRPITLICAPGRDGLDAAHQRLVGALDEQPGLLVDVADEEGGVGVAVHAVDEGGDVDVDDVAVLDAPAVRDAVADDLVDATCTATSGSRGSRASRGRRRGRSRNSWPTRSSSSVVTPGRDVTADQRRAWRRRDPAGDPHPLDGLRVLDLGAGERAPARSGRRTPGAGCAAGRDDAGRAHQGRRRRTSTAYGGV